MRYLIVAFFIFLLDGCLDLGCEYEYVRSSDKRNKYVSDNNNIKLVESIDKNGKHFTIVNHTDKTYTNNALYSFSSSKMNGAWKFFFYSSRIDEGFTYQKLNTINPKQTINKNERGQVLELYYGLGCHDYSRGKYISGKEKLFLLSLNGGKKKIFFGAYDYKFKEIWGEVDSDCKRPFIKYDIHPVWQEKDLTIHIHEDKITFDDPKIKETKKLRLSYDEYVDPYALELVDCSKE